MGLMLKIAGGVVLAVILLTVGCGALIASSGADSVHSPSYSSSKSSDSSSTKKSTSKKASGETVSQENARRSAEDYLDTSSFSRKGLIHQLKFEGYSTADATYGVDAVNPDWNEQAAKSAADYLDTSSFSRSGLIHQLKFEGFTAKQAVYGVSQTGL